MMARHFTVRRVAGGRGKVGEKYEGLKCYLPVVLARRERVGVGLSALRGDRWWLCSATVALRRRWGRGFGPRRVSGRLGR